MSITYNEAEAEKRVLDAMSDPTLLQQMAQDALFTLKQWIEQSRLARRLQGAALASRSKLSARRIAELKSIMQHTHPDKQHGDVLAFQAARRELAQLRQQLRRCEG